MFISRYEGVFMFFYYVPWHSRSDWENIRPSQSAESFRRHTPLKGNYNTRALVKQRAKIRKRKR